jgi:hypothetical protein
VGFAGVGIVVVLLGAFLAWRYRRLAANAP